MAAIQNILSTDDVSSALEQAQYELATEGRLARVGLKDRQEMAPIVARYSYLYSHAQIEAARAEMEAETGERREELTRIYHALLDGYVNARVSSLYDEVVSSLATATAVVGGKPYPFHALIPEIVRTSNAEQREQLLAGMVEVITSRNGLLSRLQAETEAAMAELGYASYPGFFAAAKRVDYARFAAVVERTLELTQPLYAEHVGAWVQVELGRPLDGLSCAHSYWLRRNQVPAKLFPAGRMEQALRRSLHAFGVDLDAQTNIHIDAENRPTKNPRACVFGARIPDEVHLIIKPTGGKGDYDAFFHEAGHAEHYACTDPNLPFAFRRLATSHAQPELFSYLMENLVNDPEWLQTYLNMSPRQARFVAYRAALNDLTLLRRYCAKFLYEYAFFARGGDGPALYTDGLRRHTGFVYPPAFWQHDRDPGFYSADYLRAWFGHAQVRTALRERFGPRWWADPVAGAQVRDLWRAGVRPEIEDVVRDMGAAVWDAGALLRYYAERIAFLPPDTDERALD